MNFTFAEVRTVYEGPNYTLLQKSVVSRRRENETVQD